MNIGVHNPCEFLFYIIYTYSNIDLQIDHFQNSTNIIKDSYIL